MSNGNTQAVERQSPVNETQDSRAISIVSVNVDRLTSYKLRSIEEYALTSDTNVLGMQEVVSKGAEYLERVRFSRVNFAEIRHNEVTSNGNYGYTTRTNRNGKTLRDFLNKYNLAIVNSYFATGAKNTNSHVTYYSKHKNNQKRSEIDFIIACKGSTPLFRKIRIKRKVGEKIHKRTKFDHQPVEALVSQKFRKYSNQNPKMHRNYKEFFKIDANRWKLNEQIRQGFEEGIAKLPLSSNSEKQPRLNFQTFKSAVKQAIENCIPLVAHERLYRTSSDRTETLFEIRRRVWKSLTENESKILKKMIRKSTLNDYKAWADLQVRRIDTAMVKNDIHEAFKQAERIVGKKRKPQRTITMEDGKYLNDKKRVKVFQEYLQLTKRNRDENIIDTELDIPEAKTEDINIFPPTLEELEETAKTLKNYKVPGPDGITNEVLKNNRMVLKYLQQLAEERFLDPSGLKKMNLLPSQLETLYFYTKKGNHQLPSNYRPIPLLNTPYKLITKIINNRLKNILERTVGSYQSEFRENTGTRQKNNQLLLNRSKLSQMENLKILCLFIDFKNAFDSCKHPFLELSLKERKVPTNFVNIILYLYKYAAVQVKIGKHISDRVEINKGVLQGDSLSPMLFVLALDSLLRRIIKKINLNFLEAEFSFQNILGFADDLCIMSKDRNILKHFVQYTEELSQLSGLKINTQKTQLMGIVRRRKLKDKLSDTAIQQLVNKHTCTSCSRNFSSRDALVGHKAQYLEPGTALVRSRKGTTAVAAAELNFLYNNIPIEENLETNLGTIKGVKTFRYLGVDITATAETHVNPSARIRSAQETLRKLQPILRSNMLTARRKKNIVKALVVSKIQYGSEFWNLENKDTSKALNKLSRDIKRTLLQPNPTQLLEHTKRANTLKAGDINILKILKEKQKSWLETCTTTEMDMELAESSRKLEAYLFPQTATPTEDLNIPLEHIGEELEHHEPRPPLHPPPPAENMLTPPQTTPQTTP
eukprot:augustus_masked-scaffold_7-processed-gene-12.62-mRNA-1 protein AED:1.00 eAED:1.00 QI:0/0/0/0/1/1/2/0/987